MRLVVDSNILLSSFWPQSVFNRVKSALDLLSPEQSLREIRKNAAEIELKSGLGPEKFKEILVTILSEVKFVPEQEYAGQLAALPKVLPQELLHDLDFIALASRLNCPLWSNDRDLKKQKLVTVLNTEEVLAVLQE